jgi:hypothetical protein
MHPGHFISCNGFCFFLPKQKEGPRQGLAESSFLIVPMVTEKSNLHCCKASKTLLREGKYEQDAGGCG